MFIFSLSPLTSPAPSWPSLPPPTPRDGAMRRRGSWLSGSQVDRRAAHARRTWPHNSISQLDRGRGAGRCWPATGASWEMTTAGEGVRGQQTLRADARRPDFGRRRSMCHFAVRQTTFRLPGRSPRRFGRETRAGCRSVTQGPLMAGRFRAEPAWAQLKTTQLSQIGRGSTWN